MIIAKIQLIRQKSATKSLDFIVVFFMRSTSSLSLLSGPETLTPPTPVMFIARPARVGAAPASTDGNDPKDALGV